MKLLFLFFCLIPLLTSGQSGTIKRRDTTLIFSVPFQRDMDIADRYEDCDEGNPCYVRYDYPGTRNPRTEFFRIDPDHYRYNRYANDSVMTVESIRTSGDVRVLPILLDSADEWGENASDGEQFLARKCFMGLSREGPWTEYVDSSLEGGDDYWAGLYRNDERVGIWNHLSGDDQDTLEQRDYNFAASDLRRYGGDIVPLGAATELRAAITGRWAAGICNSIEIASLTGLVSFTRCSRESIARIRVRDDEQPLDCYRPNGSSNFIVFKGNGSFIAVNRHTCDWTTQPLAGSWSVVQVDGQSNLVLRFRNGLKIEYAIRRLLPGQELQLFRPGNSRD